jgi:gluconokinase
LTIQSGTGQSGTGQSGSQREKATEGKPIVIVMGVTGSGKTTIGRAVATRLEISFIDGDGLHPQSNVDKMRSGTPLTDEDREPWLEAISNWLHDHRQQGAVTACSALRRKYRDILRRGASNAVFLHLDGEPSIVTNRVASRKGHFMPASLVRSQYETLEPLLPDEYGVKISFDQPVTAITDEFLDWLSLHPTSPESARDPKPPESSRYPTPAWESTALPGLQPRPGDNNPGQVD